MAHHVVACQQIPEQVLGAVQPASASAGRGQQPGPAETAFASKPAKAEPSCSSKNPSESEPSDLSDPASNSCHSCARGNVAARQPGSIFGHPFPWPPGIPFFALPWAAGQRSCSYSHLLFFDLFGQSDQIILLKGLCSGYLKFMQMPYIVHTANRYGPLIRNTGQLHTQTHISFPLWSQRVALQKQCEWGKVFLGGLQLQFK